MKKLRITIGLIMLMQVSFAQITTQNLSVAELDTNNVRSSYSATGDLFWDFTASPKFEVPKGGGKSSVFCGNLWVGGADAGGQLKMAAQTYRQNGSDFFVGPIMNQSSYSNILDNQWNRLWKINKCTIDSFKAGLYNQNNIPQVILDWPGNGNTTLGQAAELAPYADVNGDSHYNPLDGDYPCVRGDQAVFFIYNDARDVHTETGGVALGIEIRGMAYEFKSTTPSVNNSVFINYQITNRSNMTYFNTYLTSWTDFDLGNYADDYVGSDVERHAYYVYNGDQDDEGPTGYGLHPPAEGVVVLKGPRATVNDGVDNNHNCIIDEPGEDVTLTSSVYTINGPTAMGDPVVPIDYYNYMQAYWKDSTKMEYGGNGWAPSGTTNGTQCNYMFSGDSDTLYGWGTNGNCITPNVMGGLLWTEANVGNVPYDRRMMGSIGPFTFKPGATESLDLAYVYARDTSSVSSVIGLKSAIDEVQQFFNTMMMPVCGIAAGVKENKNKQLLSIFPNPTSSTLNIQLQGLKIKSINVFDITGKLVKSINKNELNVVELNVADLSNGLYLIKASDGKNVYTEKFVKE